MYRLFVSLVFMMVSSIAFSQQNRIVAHRGAWKHTGAPQNSLASLKHSFEMGCGGTEFDINLTKDNILVVNHDADYFGSNIENFTYAELNKTKLKNGEDLPLLEEFYKMALKYPNTILFAEIKPAPSGAARSEKAAEAVYQMAKNYGLLNRTIFITFSYEAAKKIVSIDPKAHTQYLTGNLSAEQLKADKIHGADYHFSIFEKNPDWIQNAKSLGLSTNAWTVNKPELMEYLLVREVDFLTTDEPEIALELDKKERRKLLWSEEFNYSGLPDATKWGYDVGGSGWGNNELQYYTEADTNNALVKGGKLIITARKENKDGKDYTSARLVTRDKKEFLYGKIEVRAKLPAGRGTWPAIWMLGTNINKVGWPKCGEIDIMEHVGYDPGVIVGTVHSEQYNHIKGTQISGSVTLEDFSTAFHTYAVDWSKDKIDFLIDNKLYVSIPNKYDSEGEWPFNNPHYLLLNLAIGGNWGGQKGIDNSIFPVSFEVDYIRVFE